MSVSFYTKLDAFTLGAECSILSPFFRCLIYLSTLLI